MQQYLAHLIFFHLLVSDLHLVCQFDLAKQDLQVKL